MGVLDEEMEALNLTTSTGGNPKAVASSASQPVEHIEWGSGDNLTHASKMTGIPVDLLTKWNGGTSNIQAGGSLKIPEDYYTSVETMPELTPEELIKYTPTVDTTEVQTPPVQAPVASHGDNMMDWFATTEGTKTATVNGTVTYPYGVEEGKFAGVDRELYKNTDGTYKDREFAKAVLATHVKTLKANHTDWDTYPKGVKEALTSYKWNYGLGVSVVSKAKEAAKLTDPKARKAKFKEAMVSMLDTFGAKDTAKGVGKKGAMTGLVKRRAVDYNRAAEDLGYTKIATYSLSNKGTGAEAVYKSADGTIISTQKSTYPIHTNNKGVINKTVTKVDKTDWDTMIA